MACTVKQVAERTLQLGSPASSTAAKHEFGWHAGTGGRRAHFLTRYLLVSLTMMLCFGCGNYREELESAKLQVDRLSSENRKMAEAAAGLEQEKMRLSDEVKQQSGKSDALRTELAALKKAKASTDDENSQLKRKIAELQNEITSLKLQKADLERERDELKKINTGPVQEGSSRGKEQAGAGVPAPANRAETKPSECLTPCDAVVAFMKRSEGIIRNNTGEQRRKLLEQVKRDMGEAMRGAPEKAVKAANSWVNELSRGWDKPGEDIVFKLLNKRNTVLDACGKKPEEAGF